MKFAIVAAVTSTLAMAAVAQTEPGWGILIQEQNLTVGIRDVKAHDEQFVSFNMLTGYLPDGRDLGLGRTVGLTIYNIVHRCGASSVQLSAGTARDLSGQVIFQTDFDPLKTVEIASDRALRASTLAACQRDKGQSQFILPATKSPDEVTLVCKIDGIAQELIVTFSESSRTINGRPGIISNESLQFSRESGGKVTSIAINRVTGQLILRSQADNVHALGSCEKSSARKF